MSLCFHSYMEGTGSKTGSVSLIRTLEVRLRTAEPVFACPDARFMPMQQPESYFTAVFCAGHAEKIRIWMKLFGRMEGLTVRQSKEGGKDHEKC